MTTPPNTPKAPNDPPLHVVKLGGSLLDLPDLPPRLQNFLHSLAPCRALLLVGGGHAAETVRDFDRLHNLGQERGHWLAIRAMQFNAHLLAPLLPNTLLVKNPQQAHEARQRRLTALVDPLLWLRADEDQGLAIPHRWTFTSDSIAAHLAHRLNAHRLTLLKSTLPTAQSTPHFTPPPETPTASPPAVTPALAAAQGIVDPEFPHACLGIPYVELVNLRQSPPTRCPLTPDTTHSLS